MWKVKKILETVLIFIFVMLLICFSVSLYQVVFNGDNDLLGKTGLYFLYTIGYGALEGDAVLQNVLAMIGIISLALMTTFLTINLFWRVDDVIIAKDINVEKNWLHFNFINKGRAICDLRVSFTLYDETTSLGVSNEYTLPILLKNSNWDLKVSLNETFWYQVVSLLLSNKNTKLYCLYSFVDTKTGQSSIKISILDETNFSLSKTIFYEPIIFESKLLQPIENKGTVALDYIDDYTKMTYNFKRKNNGFVMAYYNFHDNNLNLEKYDKGCYLEFSLSSLKPVVITLEIKNKSGTLKSLKLKVNEEETFKVYISDMEGDLEHITEICYTIFGNENVLSNEVMISDLKIIHHNLM